VDTVCPSGCNGAACITLPITLSAGFAHTCAVVSGGVKCWGGNSDGQLGNNSTTTSLVPTPVPGLPSNVLSLAAGNNHTCAVTSPATIKCWGRNEYGQLGNNSLTQSLFPVSVVGF
jgi:alpha-tubulin suppressor-like RCC1 family protein